LHFEKKSQIRESVSMNDKRVIVYGSISRYETEFEHIIETAAKNEVIVQGQLFDSASA